MEDCFISPLASAVPGRAVSGQRGRVHLAARDTSGVCLQGSPNKDPKQIVHKTCFPGSTSQDSRDIAES